MHSLLFAVSLLAAPLNGTVVLEDGVQLVLRDDRFSLKRGERDLASWGVYSGDVSRSWGVWRGPGHSYAVARRYATSNGIGIEAWELALFELKGDRPVTPVRLQARDWGPQALAERNGHLAVLATDWVWPAAGPGLGSLNYVGAWFELDGAHLKPSSPWLTRPYLFSFERERNNGQGPKPTHWLRPAKAVPQPGPFLRFGKETAPRLTGTLTSVGDDALVLTANGKPHRLQLADRGEPTPTITHLASGNTLWPTGYVPADLATWKGRQVSLQTYADNVSMLRLLP